MVPPPIATTAFMLVSSALFTCPRCAIDAPVQRRGRGRDCYQYRTTSTAASNDDDNTSEGKGADADDEQALNESSIELTTTPTTQKPKSRLAMAAADWLEEEEEDELTMYWDRFDAAKEASRTNGGNGGEQAKDRAAQVSAGQSTPTSTKGGDDANMSTEELLERYHESRGINKEKERKYGVQIEQATRSAKRASSASEAIRILDAVRPHLQYNTKLGGRAYLELAQALDANGEENAATDIYRELATSPHGDIRRQAREMLTCGAALNRPKRQYRRGIWEMLWDAGWGD